MSGENNDSLRMTRTPRRFDIALSASPAIESVASLGNSSGLIVPVTFVDQLDARSVNPDYAEKFKHGTYMYVNNSYLSTPSNAWLSHAGAAGGYTQSQFQYVPYNLRSVYKLQNGIDTLLQTTNYFSCTVSTTIIARWPLYAYHGVARLLVGYADFTLNVPTCEFISTRNSLPANWTYSSLFTSTTLPATIVITLLDPSNTLDQYTNQMNITVRCAAEIPTFMIPTTLLTENLTPLGMLTWGDGYAPSQVVAGTVPAIPIASNDNVVSTNSIQATNTVETSQINGILICRITRQSNVTIQQRTDIIGTDYGWAVNVSRNIDPVDGVNRNNLSPYVGLYKVLNWSHTSFDFGVTASYVDATGQADTTTPQRLTMTASDFVW